MRIDDVRGLFLFDGLSDEQKQAGYILPCVSKATASVEIDA